MTRLKMNKKVASAQRKTLKDLLLKITPKQLYLATWK